MGEYVSAEDYQRLQAKLKDIDKKVARAYRKRLREAAPPLGRHVLDYGIDKMPARGGLQAYLKGHSPITTSMRQSGVELWLGSKKKSQLSLLNRGMLRHRVWGHKWWVTQPVPAEAFDEAMKHIPAAVTQKLNAVITDIMKELEL